MMVANSGAHSNQVQVKQTLTQATLVAVANAAVRQS